MTRRLTVRDGYGTPHNGPRGAWWLPIREGSNEVGTRPRAELPAIRLRAWNVAGAGYAAAAVALAWRLDELVPFLVVLGGLVVLVMAGLWWITATLPARYAREIGQPAPASASQPAPSRQDVAPRPAPVVEGVR